MCPRSLGKGQDRVLRHLSLLLGKARLFAQASGSNKEEGTGSSYTGLAEATFFSVP